MTPKPRVWPEDLMQMVIAADGYRRQLMGQPPRPPHPRWKRMWVEPWFNLIGWSLGQIVAWLPWEWRWRADQRIVEWMGARPSTAQSSLNLSCSDLAAMARRLRQESGQWPAVMV